MKQYNCIRKSKIVKERRKKRTQWKDHENMRLQALPLSNVPTVDSYNTCVPGNSPGQKGYICILLSHTGIVIIIIIRAMAWSRQLSDLTGTNLVNSRRRQGRA